MNWNTLYPPAQQPSLSEISAYAASPLWDSLCASLEAAYGIAPKVEYSRCGMAPGWNVKYKKSARALCTLYPEQGAFTCLVSIGQKEAMEAEALLPGCTPAVQKLYWDTKPFNGSRWLMIPVRDEAALADALALIATRVKKK